MRTNVLLILGSVLMAVTLGEATFWILDIPRTEAFFQEFYGNGFKLMCYERDYAGTAEIDLNDPTQRARYAADLPQPAFDLNWRKTPYAVRVAYNQHGFRDREFSEKKAGSFRIIVVGDSYTYGHGLPERLAWPRQLEAQLHQRHPGRKTEVYNFGFHGKNLDVLKPIMKDALKTWEPDLLIYGYFLNDPQSEAVTTPFVSSMMELDWQHIRRAKGSLGIGERELHKLRWLALIERPFNMRRMADATVGWYRAIHEGRSWEVTKESILDIKATADATGRRFMIVVLPLIWRLHDQYPFADIHDKLGNLAAAHKIEFIDGLPHLSRYKDEELYLHPKDRHPNALYTRVIAETIAARTFPER